MPIPGFDENSLEGIVVAVLLEERKPCDAPIQGMVDVTARSDSCVSRHLGRVANGPEIVKKKVRVPFISPPNRIRSEIGNLRSELS